MPDDTIRKIDPTFIIAAAGSSSNMYMGGKSKPGLGRATPDVLILRNHLFQHET